MKNLKLILALFLFTQLNFAQQTYKVTQGKLQFINPDFGIIISDKNKIFQFIITPNYNFYTSNNVKYKYELIEIDSLSKDILFNNKANIYPNDIKKYNFNKLNKIKFISKNKDWNGDFIEHNLLKFNNEYFVTLELYEDGCFSKIGGYQILDFGNNKKILLTFFDFKTLFIPTNQGIIINYERFNKRVFYEDRHYDNNTKKYNTFIINNLDRKNYLSEQNIQTNYLFEIYSKTKNITTKNQKFEIKRKLDEMFDWRFYKTDTLKNKKVVLKNYFNIKALSKEYDSINYKNYYHTIVCYNKSKIELHNNTLKKIGSKKIKSIKFYNLALKKNPNYISSYAQILENNSLKIINEDGVIQNDSIKMELFKFNYEEVESNNNFIKKILKENPFKYKILENFEGNFARFELSNGKKGWLSKDRKEYYDE